MNSWLNTTDFIWCPGCPLIWGAITLARIFKELGLKQTNTWLVSGIGCTGRMANYFNCRTAHTTHGRAISVAEGIKLADPQKDVFVVSGDGDLLSIGLNHLIQAARRNAPVKVICFNNFLYAMTGGQTSPTTPQKTLTKTHLGGSPYLPIEPKELFRVFPDAFFGRVKVYQYKALFDLVKRAYQHPGFAFIELISSCRTYGKK